MAPLKISRPPGRRIWLDPIPRCNWKYKQISRFRWYGDWGPCGLYHEFGYSAFTERGLRRKLARMIRQHRRQRFLAYTTKVEGGRK